MKRWSLASKIYLIVSVVALGLCLVSAIGVYQMGHMNEIIEVITKERVANLVRTQKIMNHFYIQIINERNYVLHESVEARARNKGFIKQRHEEMQEMIEARSKVSTPEGLKDLMEFKSIYSKWTEFNKEIQALADNGKTKEAAALISETGRALRLEGEDILKRMNERDTKRMDEETLLATKAYNDAKNMMFVASALALFFGIFLAVSILRKLTKTIDEVIENLSENSTQVNSAAGKIAASSEELSHAVTEQAASLEETAASIEEMSSMVQKNSTNASEATSLAEQSKGNASRGQKVVENMIHAIDDINQSNQNIMVQINESNQQISEIINVIKEIESKTKVINDIVFQTKLLSFNASVEAARAGEQGKGFAVVAEEVGSLAQMSGNAAEEIAVLLDNSIHKVESIVKNTQEKVDGLVKEGRSKVETGTRIAKECGDVLETIVENTTLVTKMVEEISTASKEQSLGVQEITKAMNMLDQVTHTNTASSEEAASAAEELSAQATSLKGVVDLLVVTIKGGVEEKKEASRSISTPMPGPSHNVISFQPAPKKKEQPKKVATTKKSQPVVRKASGDVPYNNDPRFEDI